MGSKGFVPKNTAMSTKWALKNLNSCKEARKVKFPNEPVPDNLLQLTDESVLSL